MVGWFELRLTMVGGLSDNDLGTNQARKSDKNGPIDA